MDSAGASPTTLTLLSAILSVIVELTSELAQQGHKNTNPIINKGILFFCVMPISRAGVLFWLSIVVFKDVFCLIVL